jgi:hypothetical protein
MFRIGMVVGVLIVLAYAVPSAAQPSRHRVAQSLPTGYAAAGTRVEITVDLRQPQPSMSRETALELQKLLLGVGCPDWVLDNSGKWLRSASTQFTSFLTNTGQSVAYQNIGRPTLAELKEVLFKDWAPQADFIASLRTQVTYCEPSGLKVPLRVDLRRPQANQQLPNGLPIAIAKELQRMLLSVGCPDWHLDDGIWGSSSASQFTRFLEKTEQTIDYDEAHTAGEVTLQGIKTLFKGYQAQGNFIPTLNTDDKYCYPMPGGGEDEDSRRPVNVDLRLPQPRLPEADARTLQALLLGAGCPSGGKDEGKWLASSANQFVNFLQKTNQTQRYIPAKFTTVKDIKRLFIGWFQRVDFKPSLTDKPTYCQPVPRCNLNLEVGNILDSTSENAPAKDFFTRLSELNKDIKRQSTVPGSVFNQKSPETFNEVQERLTEAEIGMRSLFRHVVEERNPLTCGLCNDRVLYDIALAAGLTNITQKALEKHKDIWRDVAVLLRSISEKQSLQASKNKEKEGSGDYLEPLLLEERLLLKKFIDPVKADIADELGGFRRLSRQRSLAARSGNPSDTFRELMEGTTCLVGDGPYVMAE